MKHLILRMTAITAAILSIAVLDGIVSGQTAPWTGLFTIAALLGMAAWSYSKQTKREAPARAANTDKRQAVKLLSLIHIYFDFDDSPARSFADYNAAVFFGR